MKKDDFNIMGDIKIIEEIKAQIICILGELFLILTKGTNVVKNSVVDCIASLIILLYVLADKLGYSAIEVDENIKKSLKVGIVEEDELEKKGNNLTKLFNHLKERR
ncbi:MazG-like family protein [Clostridium tarantellae]|uniref:MazG-like family protein n=1 Tax=Clostridium tarantellae TaxID=39493 RepID=A0A6I1MLA4_9CLOT|nr:MazG-like family protein [Clostridium tarantellae]MPQ43764.1 MazG-like family protein [Clostridium tarantellae]